MSIVLIGYRGCGKTTIGRKLADRLWQQFVDLDEMIVKKDGRTIREIFQQDGQERFREMETAALRDVMELEEHVIALGGGAVVRPENQRILGESKCRLIYLHCEPEELLRRIQADPQSAQNRPNLTELGGGLNEVREKLAERVPVYRQVMDAELDVTNLTPDETLVRIVRML